MMNDDRVVTLPSLGVTSEAGGAIYRHESPLKFLRSNFIIGEICIRILLATVWLVLRHTQPFLQVFALRTQWQEYAYPYSGTPKIPGKLLFGLCCIIPAATGLVCVTMSSIYMRRQITYRFIFKELCFFALAATLALLLAGSITNIIKIFIGRPRPDYLSRCFPSKFNSSAMPMIDLMDVITSGNPTCEANSLGLIDGRKSFPSGHSSYLASVCMCSALYINHTLRLIRLYGLKVLTAAGKSRATHRRWGLLGTKISLMEILTSPSINLCLCLALATIVPSWAAATRIIDRRHHPSDVIGGLLIGAVLGFISYYIYYARSGGSMIIQSTPAMRAYYPTAPTTAVYSMLLEGPTEQTSTTSTNTQPMTAKTL